MPVNLNALLRYKTINDCLRNRFAVCNIDYLIKKCSEAISAKLGAPTSVSERSIRNDIRILRSDILGFNAPIVCTEGVYSYADSEYSIFNTAIADRELLIDIQNLLLEEFDKIKSQKITNMIISLSEITGEKIPDKYGSQFDRVFQRKIFTGKKPSDSDIFTNKLDNYLITLRMKRKKLQKKSFIANFIKPKTKVLEIFKWEFILGAL